MSKKRNHYIPQFLLRRFVSREKRGRHWLWQFRKGKAPVEVVTRNAAVATFFYGQPETGVEDSLADLEGEQAALLRDLDAGASPDGRSQELRQLLWSLAFRTRALRGQIGDVLGRLLAKMGAVEDKTIADAFGREITNTFDHHLDEVLSKLPAQERAFINQLFRSPGVSGEASEHVRREIIKALPMVGTLLKQAADGMQKAADSGHVQGLRKLFAEEKAVPDRFEVPSWSIQQFVPNSVVLGDGVVFAVGPDGNAGALGRFTKDFVAIYAPISHKSVLVGRRIDDAPGPGLGEINSASVQLSLDTFFASRSTDVELRLADQVGTGEPILTDEDLRRIASDSWNALGKPRSEG